MVSVIWFIFHSWKSTHVYTIVLFSEIDHDNIIYSINKWSYSINNFPGVYTDYIYALISQEGAM